MEEIDNIIIHTLKQIGCNLDEDVSALSLFTPEMIVESASKCINIIQPTLDLPLTLPSNMALRFKVTAAIAAACKDIGYNGDIGYQAFLYSNENDLRKVFMFLIEHLPKDSDKDIVASPRGLAEELYHAIANVVHKQMTAPYIYPECKKNGIRVIDDKILSVEGRPSNRQIYESLPITVPHTYLPDISQAKRNFWVKYLPSILDQVNSNSIVQSITSHNALLRMEQDNNTSTNVEIEVNYQKHLSKEWKKLNKTIDCASQNVTHNIVNSTIAESSLQISAPAGNDVKINTEVSVNSTEMINELLKETQNLTMCIDNYSTEINSSQSRLQNIMDKQNEEDCLHKKAVEKYELIVKSRTLLDNCDDNLIKLKNKAEASAQKLVYLSKQWEEHKETYMVKYQNAKTKANSKSSESQQIQELLATIEEQCKNLSEQIIHKTSQQAILAKEYENANKDINRSAYTRRIMEIIGNIGKQKADLDKVLNDTRNLQKEINNLTGQLQRSFMETDELIFEDAKRSELGRTAYKLLATMHTDCKSLVETVEATGAAVREARDLEEQIQQESSKQIADSLARVKRDLDSMRQDSAELIRLIEDKKAAQGTKN